MSSEETVLLNKISSGVLDGVVGDSVTTDGGSTVWKEIKNGIPMMLKRGPGGKLFTGKENESYDGVLHVLEKWGTEERILSFLQKYGWLINDPDVKAYSARFKPKK